MFIYSLSLIIIPFNGRKICVKSKKNVKTFSLGIFIFLLLCLNTENWLKCVPY